MIGPLINHHLNAPWYKPAGVAAGAGTPVGLTDHADTLKAPLAVASIRARSQCFSYASASKPASDFIPASRPETNHDSGHYVRHRRGRYLTAIAHNSSQTRPATTYYQTITAKRTTLAIMKFQTLSILAFLATLNVLSAHEEPDASAMTTTENLRRGRDLAFYGDKSESESSSGKGGSGSGSGKGGSGSGKGGSGSGKGGSGSGKGGSGSGSGKGGSVSGSGKGGYDRDLAGTFYGAYSESESSSGKGGSGSGKGGSGSGKGGSGSGSGKGGSGSGKGGSGSGSGKGGSGSGSGKGGSGSGSGKGSSGSGSGKGGSGSGSGKGGSGSGSGKGGYRQV
jgi:hypothetical protein